MTDSRRQPFLGQAKIQARVIWALTMREVITRYGREGLGSLWLIIEPAMFIIGVMVIFSHIDANPRYSISEWFAVSYPTLLFWRNGANRVTKALEINRALLHHQPIKPLDIVLSRILLEFSAAAASFISLYIALIPLGVCRPPADPLTMALGLLLIIWFSLGFVLTMAALSELSQAIERVSHIIIYLMLPFCGVFIPTFLIPPSARETLLLFPLVDAVEYFHSGYYGARLPTFYHLPYTIVTLLALTLFSLLLLNMAARRVQIA